MPPDDPAGADLTIGAFAERTGVSARMLRHYEQEDLLRPAARDANGYRRYHPEQAADAVRIRDLLAAGLPARIVRELRGCLTGTHGIYPEHIHPDMLANLHDELDRMCRCVECIVSRRDALRTYIDNLETGEPDPESDS